MHQLSTAVPQSSSLLHRLRDPQAQVPPTRKQVPSPALSPRHFVTKTYE